MPSYVASTCSSCHPETKGSQTRYWRRWRPACRLSRRTWAAIRNSLLQEKTGALVGAEDPVAMAAAIARYAVDPQLARAHGAEGRKRVLAHFSMDAMLARYLAVYDALTNSEGGGSHA